MGAAAVALVLLGGCRIETLVDIEADASGSGDVTVDVNLDRDAALKAPDLRPRVADLRRAGWEVRGPIGRPSGGITLTARKRFRSPAEAARVVAEVAGGGPDDPLRDLRLLQSRSFAKTRTRFVGTLDLSRGVESFSDAELQRQLGGQPLGVASERLEALNRGLLLRVRARLPGGGASWDARNGQRVDMRAASEAWNVPNLVFAALAVVFGVACVIAIRNRLRPP